MKVLVTWSSTRGGTEGIAQELAATLRERGFAVSAKPVESVDSLEGVEAVVVGAALYANRWTSAARRFIRRHTAALRERLVWLFSSGPLDRSAEASEIPPAPEVAELADRIGAREHRTFGGRLEPDARGFASAMAKTMSGDYRNPEQIRAWGHDIADALPHAQPGSWVEQPGGAPLRVLTHGALGWGVCALVTVPMISLGAVGLATVTHGLAAALVFGWLSWHYFGVAGPQEPLPTAAVWTAIVAGLDIFVVGLAIHGDTALLGDIVGTWLPWALVFIVSWVTGFIMAMKPWTMTSHPTAHHELENA